MTKIRAVALTALVAAGLLAAGVVMFSPHRAEAQGDSWRDLGGINGVSLYSYRDANATCYVSSAGGVSCVKR